MLDKLVLTSPEKVTFEDSCKNLKGHFSHYTKEGTKYHSSVHCFYLGYGKVGKHLLTLHLEPKPGFNSSELKLEMNPSSYKSFQSLSKTIGLICDPEHLEIRRIDHAVDLHCPVEEVRGSLTYSRKKHRSDYGEGNRLTGYYLGKPPEILVVYDKALLKKIPGPLTRVELRHFREKVPIREFSKIQEYSKLEPFSQIKFQRIKSGSPQTLTEMRRRELLATLMPEMSAQGALKMLNRHSNFKRNFSGSLEPNPDIPDLNKIYQDNLKQFFQGEICG